MVRQINIIEYCPTESETQQNDEYIPALTSRKVNYVNDVASKFSASAQLQCASLCTCMQRRAVESLSMIEWNNVTEQLKQLRDAGVHDSCSR